MNAPMSSEEIAVLGVGYVGLPTAVCLASFGYTVRGYDNNPTKIRNLSEGLSSVLEPGLRDLLREGVDSKRLMFTSLLPEAVSSADIVFVCLPTPPKEDGAADMRIIYEAALTIREHLKSGAVLVIKSSVPMGESISIERILSRDDIKIVSNPEFLREGHAIFDTLNPGRIVVGAKEESVARRVASLFQSGNIPLLITDNTTAETVKYVSNAFLATKTSFINQVANLCDVVGANSDEVFEGMSLDPRIGNGHMRPGPGWGGPCLTKDSKALFSIGLSRGYEFTMVKAAIEANELQLTSIVEKVNGLFARNIKNKCLAIWGLTFKADTDDMRNSPAIEIARRLTEQGARVRAYDPMLERNENPRLEFLQAFENPYEACRDAEALIILTEWNEFKLLDFTIVGTLLKTKMIIDARNVLDPNLLHSLGFNYVGLGRRKMLS